MARLTAPQIAGYASAAGFRGRNLVIAVAVSLAESGGRTDAVNRTNANGTQDYGLWQINSVHADLLSSGSWSNPADNARMAYTVWKGQGWRGWSTYNNGAYLAHLGVANVAASNPAATARGGGAAGFTKVRRVPKPYRVTNAGNIIYIDGKKYDGGKAPYFDTIPPHAVTRMAQWIVATFPGKNPITDFNEERSWLAGKIYGQSTKKDMGAQIATHYALAVYGIESGSLDQAPITPGHGLPSPIPGTPQIVSAADGIAALVEFLTNAHNWQRVGYFTIGGSLVLFASYRFAGSPLPKVVPV